MFYEERVSMKLKSKMFIFLVLSMFILSGVTSIAATPPANAEIGNQATLEYVDGTGISRTVLSNIVITTVNPVYGVEITPDNELQGLTNEIVYFVHTVTNLGNTDDSFNITTGTIPGDYNPGSVKVYIPDINGIKELEGPIDLRAGEAATIVVSAASALSTGSAGDITVTATSENGVNINDSAIDNLTITDGPVINAYKTYDKDSGAAGEDVVATFSVLNTGGDIGKDFILTDTLDDRLVYVGNAAVQIGNDSNWQTITPGNTVGGVEFTMSGQDMTITVAGGIPTQSGTNNISEANLKFRFTMKTQDNLPAQTIPNTGVYSYDNSAGGAPITNAKTNTATYTILQYAGVTFTGQTLETVEQGALVMFNNTITNTGNGPDTFDITLIQNEFPSGTDFYLSFDGVGAVDDFEARVPLIDTTGSGNVDTGIMEVGEVKHVLLWAQLPREAVGADLKVSKLGVSNFDRKNEKPEPASAIALDQVNTINPAAVDLTNNYSLTEKPNNAPGKGMGPEVAPVTEIEIIPGETGYFNLYVNNTSAYLTDEYALDVSTDSSFRETTIPEGIEVTFETAGGAELRTTGPISPQNFFNVRAVVKVDTNTLAGNISLFFRARSLTTGASDIKHDMVKIGILRNLSILPNNRGETYAGSSIYYTHTVTNGGNVVEGGGSDSSVALLKLKDNKSGRFSSTTWLDVDKNGVLEKGIDKQITDLATIGGLKPGESIQIFVEVNAALNAKEGEENTTTVRLDITKGVYNVFHPDVKAEDITKIILDAIVIEKLQGTTANPGFDPSNPANFKRDPQKAGPEDYIYYKIVVTNTGTTTVEDVVIEDIIPQYTTMSFGTLSSNPGFNSKPSWRKGTGSMSFADTHPNEGEKGIIKAVIGSLAPDETAELYFNVKIDGSKTASAN